MDQTDKRKEKALFRFGIIFPLLDERLPRAERSRILDDIVAKEYDVPGSTKATFTKATVEKWVRDYRKEPNIDTLFPSERNDKDKRRRLSAETELALVELRDRNPGKTLKAVVEMAEERGIFKAGDTIGMASLYRMFQKRSDGSVDAKGEDMRRFSVSLAGELWQTDCMHGPKATYKGKTIVAMLFAFIDDCSRLCVYGEFYPSESTDCFLACMWEAFRRRGLPHRIYTDHGSAECNDRVKLGCASLEIGIQYAKVRRPVGKGKVERLWLTVREQFLAMLPPEPLPLEELNRRWSVWMESYNRRPHSALHDEQGRNISPLQRYLQDIVAIRKAPEDLPRYFWRREKRTVSTARTVSIGNRLFQVPLGYSGKRIEVRYHDLDHVEGWFLGKQLGVLPEVDQHANADYRRGLYGKKKEE